MAPSAFRFTLYVDMTLGPKSSPRSPLELVEILQSRISTAARSYRLATVRYLMRPPLSLRPKYVAFLLDLAHQSDHMQEVLGRAADRVGDGPIARLLRNHHREERNRMQLVMADLRRLGYAEELPQRVTTSGDAALRAYSTTMSYERPTAMLGILLVFLGVAAEISPIVVRLLSVGSVPKEAMGWLLLRQSADPQAMRDLLSEVAELVTEPFEQSRVLESAEVTGELLALGAAARPAMN
jgi:hypothetical protein